MGPAYGHLGIGERCRCGHNPAKHSVAGMDGECVTCTCSAYRPREQAITTHAPVTTNRTLVGVPWLSVQVADIDNQRPRNQHGTPDRSRRSNA